MQKGNVALYLVLAKVNLKGGNREWTSSFSFSFFFFFCKSFFQQYIYIFHWPTYITGFPISWYVPPCSVWYLKNENLCVIRLTLFKCRKMTNLLQGFFMADIIKLWKFLLMLQKNGLFPVNQYLCNIYTTCWALAVFHA